MTRLTVLRPVSEPPTGASTLALAPRGDLTGRRLAIIENGKPRAADLLEAIAARLVDRHGLASATTFAKAGASQPVDADELAAVVAAADVVLTGLGDCGGCSACSLQDALLVERAGRPATVVISEPFQGRIAAYAAKLGAPGYGAVVVPHPVATRSDSDLELLADHAVDQVARHLGGSHR
jgi:hypothetical protein